MSNGCIPVHDRGLHGSSLALAHSFVFSLGASRLWRRRGRFFRLSSIGHCAQCCGPNPGNRYRCDHIGGSHRRNGNHTVEFHRGIRQRDKRKPVSRRQRDQRLRREPSRFERCNAGLSTECGRHDSGCGDSCDHIGRSNTRHGNHTQSSSTVASGNVISQNPASGASVASGSAVNLVVSTGPPTYAVSVSVSGLTSGSGSITVLDNGTDSLTFISNSTQQFATQLQLGATYSVTESNPPSPEICTLTGASGQVTGPVSVSIACSSQPPSTSYPAFTASYPLVLSPQTPAVVIASPRIIPVFFTDVPAQAATLTALQTLIASPEWSALSEYGVGPATIGAPVYLTSAAPSSTTISGIGTYITANVASWGTLDGSEIFYYCTTPLQLRSQTWATSPGTIPLQPLAAQEVPYAVIPNYQQVNGYLNVYLQYHELGEATTDPTGGGFNELNHDYTAWSFVGTELADLCTSFSTFGTSVSTFMHGIWSDAAVNQGLSPCTTAGSSNLGYAFGAYPVLPDTYIGSNYQGDSNASVGIARNSPAVTIPINVFSYGPLTTPISLNVTQFNTNSAKTNALGFSLDQDSGLNGSVAHLTITAPQTPLSATTNYGLFLVTATTPSTGNNHPQSIFPGLVTNPGASCGTLGTGVSNGGETVVYGFTGAGGKYPEAGLALGTDGNFYGTTYQGGASNDGTVFKITPGGTLTTLHSFAGSDGLNPYANLTLGTDGNFYGTTFGGGGTGSYGTVFKITPSGTLTTLHSFTISDGANLYAGLALGTDGNFYGTTYAGGAGAVGTVFKITPSGTLTTLHSFAIGDGAYPIRSSREGTDSNFYGTTAYGGGNSDGTVFKITPSGTLTTLHSFAGGLMARIH